MKPGVTMRSLAEITFSARSLAILFETTAILPSLIATSIGACKPCEGSTTVPPSISKSNVGVAPCCGVAAIVTAARAPPEVRSAAPPATKYFENSRRLSINVDPLLFWRAPGNVHIGPARQLDSAVYHTHLCVQRIRCQLFFKSSVLRGWPTFRLFLRSASSIGDAVPVRDGGQFLVVGDLAGNKYIHVRFQVGHCCLNLRAWGVLFPAFESKAAARHIFAFDDLFPSCAANTRDGLDRRALVFALLLPSCRMGIRDCLGSSVC